MLLITIPDTELWDETNQEFVYVKRQTLQLEHSLVSISKWESRWRKRFFSKEEKTNEETLDYIRCMTVTPNVRSEVYRCLTAIDIQRINAYIEAKLTATSVPQQNVKGGGREPVTSELIYYWMVSLGIPFECQKWHLSRLLALIEICNYKNTPPKKRSRREILSQNAALNAARRQKLNTKG